MDHPRGLPPPHMMRPRGPFDGPFGRRPMPPFGPRGPPLDWRLRGLPPFGHPGMLGDWRRGPLRDWGPRGPPPGEFGHRGPFRPRGPMDGLFRGPLPGEFGPRGLHMLGDFGPMGDFRGPRPDMYLGPGPFGIRALGSGESSQYNEEMLLGDAQFSEKSEPQKEKKKNKKKKKESVEDAKFPTQKKEPKAEGVKEESKDKENDAEVDEDKLLASDDDDSSSSSSSEESDTEPKKSDTPQLPTMQHQPMMHQMSPQRHQMRPATFLNRSQYHHRPNMQDRFQHHALLEHPPTRFGDHQQIVSSMSQQLNIQNQPPTQVQPPQILQPGQVLIRQMIPGVAQPVFRTVTLQPGQLLPGQISGQHLNIQSLPEQQAQALQAAIRHGQAFQQSNYPRVFLPNGQQIAGQDNSIEPQLPKQGNSIMQIPGVSNIGVNSLQQQHLTSNLSNISHQRPTLLTTANGISGQIRSLTPGGQPIFIPNSSAMPGQPHNLHATLQASQALILQQQQQLAAVQQQQLALQAQHQQAMQKQHGGLEMHDGRRSDGRGDNRYRAEGKDVRRNRDNYNKRGRYRSRSRSFSRSQSRSWTGSESGSRSSMSGSQSNSDSRSRSRSWSSADSRSPSPQRKRREKNDLVIRSSERPSRQHSSHHKGRDPQRNLFNKDTQRYEELEKQRLRERERRDRETNSTTRVERVGFSSAKRHKEDRDQEARDVTGEIRTSDLRTRTGKKREDRKDSKSHDHVSSRDQIKTAQSQDVGNRVLISSLPPSMSERKLRALMQSVGEVENLKLSTTRHKALVAFTKTSTAVACRKKFHKMTLDECRLIVEFA
ncbi:uncharacterized protein LOC100207239 isoform X4 [Hydra vulgaris]|uniref:Uncharacterized protein LOC100207239 isoform X4 n=1 Tax=Hydra vulgaris TaxID=6087 RepID=A0ABM4CY00_HYDVU